MPKRNTAEGIKSHIKNSIQDEFNKNISVEVEFPGIERRWKSFIAELVKQGRNDFLLRQPAGTGLTLAS